MGEFHGLVCDSCGTRVERSYNADAHEPIDWLSVVITYPSDPSPVEPLMGTYCGAACMMDRLASFAAGVAFGQREA
jgi:hypothetical protein